MATQNYRALDLFLQLQADIRRSAEMAMRAVQLQPCVDMYETADSLMVKIELAGVEPDRLKITLEANGRLLTIAGERTERLQEQSECLRYYQLEIYYGAFERQIPLPPEVSIDREHIVASYRDGILLISLPRRTEQMPETCIISINNDRDDA